MEDVDVGGLHALACALNPGAVQVKCLGRPCDVVGSLLDLCDERGRRGCGAAGDMRFVRGVTPGGFVTVDGLRRVLGGTELCGGGRDPCDLDRIPGCRTRSTLVCMDGRSEVPLRELNQQTSRVMARVAAGETVTITKDGVPIGDIVPHGVRDGIRTGRPVYAFRTDPMGLLDIPDLGGPVLGDDEIGETLRGMGAVDG